MSNHKDFFGKNTKEWEWETFKDTTKFPVSDRLLDHVVGQDRVLTEVQLALDEWLYKIEWLQKNKWYESWLSITTEKPLYSKMLTSGPHLLLLGDVGTGKSLIGKAMAEYLEILYKKHNIKRFDVLSWKNPIIPSNPRISMVEAGEGKEVLYKATRKIMKKSFFARWGLKILMGFLGMLGLTFLGLGLYGVVSLLNEYGIYIAMSSQAQMLMIGGTLLLSTFMLYFFSKVWGNLGNNNLQGIGGASSSNGPKILIDNSNTSVPFIEATGHTSSQLYGSLIWDPYQSGGLGTPEHQRVTIGDVHRANLGILYIDEIKNLHSEEAITLLSVMEDGVLPITMRSMFHGADTSAMAISTEPIPALFFLLAAGNFDSIPHIHPALMDRLVGYGRVVRMNNEMDNTLENRRKYIQFIAQESKRFHTLPFNREACIEIIEEGRRRSNKRNSLCCKFRPLIAIIRTASTLARNKGKEHVDREEVIEAVEVHCKTIQKQLLEHYVEEHGKFLEITPQGHRLGVIYGLAVTEDSSGERTGEVLRIKAQMIKKKKNDKRDGYYKVSGIAKSPEWINDSIDKVRSVILKKYGVDIAQEYFTHIDFSQARGVDGPSAGVTMTILLCSLIEGKSIRQDIAVTGEINISSEDEVDITAIGGCYEKIKSAEQWGFKKVLIPMKNFKFSIKENDYKIEVKGCSTLDQYLQEILVE